MLALLTFSNNNNKRK
nr:hypothetical protein [Fontibacillus phaseoli]